jgi:hypothetical protein
MTPSRSPFIDLQKGLAVEFGHEPLSGANAGKSVGAPEAARVPAG